MSVDPTASGTADVSANGAVLSQELAESTPLKDIDVSNDVLFERDTVGAYLARLRREAPLHFCADSPAGPFWSVTRFRDIQQLELKHDVFSSQASLGGTSISSGGQPMRHMFMMSDPPVHEAERGAVNGITQPQNINQLKDTIRTNVCEILDGLPRGEPFDWVERVSVELTTRMLATIFDFPFEQRSRLTFWSDIYSGTPQDNGPVTSWEMRREQLRECLECFRELIDARAKLPAQPNLLSMLAHSPVAQDMSPSGLLGNLMLLVVGGNDTTRNSISGGLLALISHPDEFQKLRDNPAMVSSLVPEIIRWQTPIAHMARTARSDFDLHGQTIRAGDRVALWYLSANRDEAVIEHADRFIIDRSNPRRHLSFGFGIHHCMGSRLAETQLTILWEEILRRKLRFELAGQPERTRSNIIHGFVRMPVVVASDDQ